MKKVIAFIGIIFLVIGISGCIYMKVRNENTAIIGGADTPTFIFLTDKEGILPFLCPVFVIAGFVLAAVSVILKMKKK